MTNQEELEFALLQAAIRETDHEKIEHLHRQAATHRHLLQGFPWSFQTIFFLLQNFVGEVQQLKQKMMHFHRNSKTLDFREFPIDDDECLIDYVHLQNHCDQEQELQLLNGQHLENLLVPLHLQNDPFSEITARADGGDEE